MKITLIIGEIISCIGILVDSIPSTIFGCTFLLIAVLFHLFERNKE